MAAKNLDLAKIVKKSVIGQLRQKLQRLKNFDFAVWERLNYASAINIYQNVARELEIILKGV